MAHHENLSRTSENTIKNPLDAHTITEEEKPYRNFEVHAKRHGLGHVAVDMARQERGAGNAVQAVIETASGDYKSHEHSSLEPLKIVTRSFEEARHGIKKEFSDAFIDAALTRNLKIEENKVFTIKSYLDNVPMASEERELSRSPKEIASLYRETSEVVLRNLNVILANNTSSDRAAKIRNAKQKYIDELAAQIPSVEQAIVAWCDNPTENEFPVAAVEYQGFTLDGQAMMDSRINDPSDTAANIKIQREIAGTFIMAYSNNRMFERKLKERSNEPDRRIYLNPSVMATPFIFEQILRMANEKGLTLQLKMIQRASELASEHQRMKNSDYTNGTLRGDGIVVYLNHTVEDQVLDEILNIVEQNTEAFRGRSISKTPVKIADGVAIGDEPLKAGESLTSHRANIISLAINHVTQAGINGQAARAAFRREFAAIAKSEHVAVENFAFNG